MRVAGEEGSGVKVFVLSVLASVGVLVSTSLGSANALLGVKENNRNT